MPDSTFTCYNDFFEQIGKAVHDLSSHTIKAAFTNTAPDHATHTVLADITQLATGGGYTGGAGGGVALDNVAWTQSGGVITFSADTEVFTATGADVGPFRYVVFYNDSATSPADALIASLDYGVSMTLFDGEPFNIVLDNDILTLQAAA